MLRGLARTLYVAAAVAAGLSLGFGTSPATVPCGSHPRGFAWPTEGLSVSSTIVQQTRPFVMPAVHGVQVVWCDTRDPSRDRLRARGLSEYGTAGPSAEVTFTDASQSSPDAVAAPESSYVAVWREAPAGGEGDIRVQRGYGDHRWPSFPPEGIAVCTAAGDQTDPAVAFDGREAFYVAWTDARNAGASGRDIYVQRFHEYGQLWEGWPTGGIALCTAPGDQREPAIVADGAGGAYVLYHDDRNGADGDLFASRVGADGAIPAGWESGKAIASGPATLIAFAAASDSAGGLYVAWTTAPNGTTVSGREVRLTRIGADGAAASGWPAEGATLAASPDFACAPTLVADGAGGALVAWTDLALGSDPAARLARYAPDGIPPVGWTAGGVQLGRAHGSLTPVGLVPVAGGVIAAWTDTRDGADVVARRVDSNGAFSPAWPAGGVDVTNLPEDQLTPNARRSETNGGAIASDGLGGAILVWKDYRAPAGAAYYAQRVGSDGQVAGRSWWFVPCSSPRGTITRTFPQPVRTSVVIEAFAPLDRSVVFDLYDVSGRFLRSVGSASVPMGRPGLFRYSLDLSKDPPGVYLARCRQGGRILGAARLVVFR